jgi:TM2 domain-containing membrane protein YozV
MNTSNKNRLVALLLSLFFGNLGVHRFYVGKVGTGVLMLILTLSFIGILISSFWNLIDFIFILAGKFKDKNNLEIKNWR